MEDFLGNPPPDVRQGFMSMPPQEQARRMARRRRMLGSMDEESRRGMLEHFELVRQRPPAPDVGDVAPEFELPVLGGNGDRVQLASLRGTPVGLIFGSFT